MIWNTRSVSVGVCSSLGQGGSDSRVPEQQIAERIQNLAPSACFSSSPAETSRPCRHAAQSSVRDLSTEARLSDIIYFSCLGSDFDIPIRSAPFDAGSCVKAAWATHDDVMLPPSRYADQLPQYSESKIMKPCSLPCMSLVRHLRRALQLA